MNYRHDYHAGNASDVVKHAVLSLWLSRLCREAAPLCMMDTHAGEGMYDLHHPHALKTQEAQTGFLKLTDEIWETPLLMPYQDILTRCSDHHVPGSPFIFATFQRAQDRLHAFETQPTVLGQLQKNVRLFMSGKQREQHIKREDGFTCFSYLHEALKQARSAREEEKKAREEHHRNVSHRAQSFQQSAGRSPEFSGTHTSPTRTLIFCDPPFESFQDFDRQVTLLQHAALEGAHLMMWYPLKERARLWPFYQALQKRAASTLWMLEFYQDAGQTQGLGAFGLALLNPIHLERTELKDLMEILRRALGNAQRSLTRVFPLEAL